MNRRSRTCRPLHWAIAAASLLPAAFVQAQSCVSPLPFASGVRMSGDTCLSQNYVASVQGLPSPQNDRIYRIDPADVVNRRLYFEAPDYEMTAYFTTGCAGDAGSILALAELAPGQDGVLNLPSFAVGPHYLIVTGPPWGAYPYDQCGQYGFSDLDPAIITDSSAFRGALVPGYYLEPFKSFPQNATPTRIDFGNGTYAYRANPLGTNAQFTVPTTSQGRPMQALAVATSSGPGSIRLLSTGASFDAIGGQFFQTSLPMFARQGTIRVSLRSGTTVRTYTVRGSSSQFRGFVSIRPIDEIVISAVGLSGRLTLDNVIIGTLRP